jgi:hypothetical protein
MNFEQPPVSVSEEEKGESEQLSPEQIKILLQTHSDEYDRQMKITHEAATQFDLALKEYGREHPITQDKKKQWDYVERAKAEIAELIEQDMIDFPEYKDIFKI